VIAAAAAAITIAGVSYAGDRDPGDDDTETDAQRTITVSGTGTITVDPDTATAYLGIGASAVTGDAAMDEVNAQSAALVEALHASGVADDDIETTSVSLSPQYDDDYEFIIGYEASIEVSVRISHVDQDASRIGDVIEAAQNAGGEGFTIGGVAFSYSDPAAVREQARVAAGAEARQAAEQIAQGAGATVGSVVMISEGAVNVPPPTVLYDVAPAAAPAEQDEAGPVVLAGQLDYQVTVTATFVLL
jgi:uncharacterized protein YggE